MKILTIDDHALFRQGLKFLLKGFDSSVEVVEASTLAETLSLPDKESVEFILLDYHLPDSKGIASLTRIAPIYENAVIVILSGEEDPNLIKEAIDRGAAGGDHAADRRTLPDPRGDVIGLERGQPEPELWCNLPPGGHQSSSPGSLHDRGVKGDIELAHFIQGGGVLGPSDVVAKLLFERLVKADSGMLSGSGFERRANGADIFHIMLRQLNHPAPPYRVKHHKPFPLQLPQRFANWCSAN